MFGLRLLPIDNLNFKNRFEWKTESLSEDVYWLCLNMVFFKQISGISMYTDVVHDCDKFVKHQTAAR